MSKTRTSSMLIIIGGLLGAAACGIFKPPPPTPTPTPTSPVFLMILADVTKSLRQGEVQQVAKLASDVLDKFPDSTDYVIYPIHRETQKPTSLDEAHPGNASGIKLTASDKDARRQRIKDKIVQLYEEINKKQPTDRTCIINALEIAEKHFGQIGLYLKGAKDGCFDLVIISDMIEQCALNAGNIRIDLKEQSIAEAISKLDKLGSFPNLTTIHITIIIPTSEESTPYATDQPTVSSLEAFWAAVFTRCRFKAEDIQHFNWLPSIPPRLGTACQ
jgi:hypothetical protein